jgi:predicted RNase H-like HicB family nuclease
MPLEEKSHTMKHVQKMTVNNRSSNELPQTELDYTYWQSRDGWLVGYLNIWPDHLTQGRTLPEFEEMLADLYEFYKEEKKKKKIPGKLKITA